MKGDGLLNLAHNFSSKKCMQKLCEAGQDKIDKCENGVLSPKKI